MENLEKSLAKTLAKKRKTLSVAESCTGGLISNRLTNIAGSSKYFKAGVIAYSNEIKIRQLKVPSRLIKQKGAVSKEVAVSMAKNIRKISRSNLGLAVTGIAGPGGGTKTKPVGLVYIAISSHKKHICKEFRFKGNRLAIKSKTATAALRLLKDFLKQ
ncbi:MAG: CinA family protein [Candidatus Omnitrophica bacterium]|nr:CinA family protein [Candidatus Omnitrophota bacterium]